MSFAVNKVPDWTQDTRIQEIVDYVERERVRLEITPIPDRKRELSGEGHGEFNCLLSSLLCTPNFVEAWQELLPGQFQDEIIAGVKGAIEYRKRGRNK